MRQQGEPDSAVPLPRPGSRPLADPQRQGCWSQKYERLDALDEPAGRSMMRTEIKADVPVDSLSPAF